MSDAWQTIYKIRPATTDLSIRLGFVVFLRGSLRRHTEALEDLWVRLQAGLLRKRFTRSRLAGDTSWTALPLSRTPSSFAQQFGVRRPLAGSWRLELAEERDDSGRPYAGLWLQLSDLAPVRGMDRASHLRVLFPDETSGATLAALAEWTVNRLPLWWGSAGFVFHHTGGTMFTAHKHMAVHAKRYWGVQIQDMTALQWDALRGMPGVNWLSLIGDEFARSREMTSQDVRAAAAGLSVDGISYRQGAHGVALAAGPQPLQGDINAGEALTPYVRVAQVVQPLLLTEHTPLFGPFAKPEVLGAWLGRFANPGAWLECDISMD